MKLLVSKQLTSFESTINFL